MAEPPTDTRIDLKDCPIEESLPAPALAVDELHWCQGIGPHFYRTLRNSVFLSMLVNKFFVPIPIEFVRRLSEISDSGQEEDDDPTTTAEYWIRIADTCAKLFALEVVLESGVDEEFMDSVETAWGCYYTAVEYAIEIDAHSFEEHLVILLDKALVDCGAAVHTLFEQIGMLKREEEGENPIA